MNRSLWGLQIVLGIYFILVGIVHFVMPSGLPGLLTWMYELPDALQSSAEPPTSSVGWG